MQTKSLPNGVDCAALLAAADHVALRAACKHLRRKCHIEWPEGKYDSAKRFYPDASECLDTSQYRTPSARWPNSYRDACCTAAHCAQLTGCADVTLVRTLARKIQAAENTERALAAVNPLLAAATAKKLRSAIRQKAAAAMVAVVEGKEELAHA